MKNSYLLSLLLGTAVTFSGHASIVMSDDFSDNDRTTNPAWYVVNSATGVVINESAGVLSLGRTASNSHTYLASHWAGTTLASVGDQLAFSFSIKMTGDQGNRTNEISFGIGNNGGTVVAADGDSASYVNDFGYLAMLSTGSGSSTIIRDAGTANWLGRTGSGDHTPLSVATPGMSLASSFKDYTLTLERTADGLDIQLSDGTTSVSVSDNAVPSNDFYTFNTVSFGYYNRNTANFVDVDNLSVTYTAVPEPGTTAIITAAGMLGFAILRRRKLR